MALSGILWTSTSGLQAVQQQLQWRTDNISNAQSPSYGRRDAVTSSTGVNSVQVDVARAVDNGLQDQFLSSNSQSSYTNASLSYMQRIGDILGTTQTTSYLQQKVDDFTGSWKAFETNPSDTSAESQVISSGQALAQKISTTSQSLAQVSDIVSGDVGASIDTLNTNLQKLSAVNKQLSAEPLATLINPSLLDTRDSLVRDISSIVGVTRIVHADNSVALYTNTGVALVDHDANQFGWNSSTGDNPIMCIRSPSGALDISQPLNSDFTGGKLGAALNVLSGTNNDISNSDPTIGAIAKARAQVDNLAVQLAGQAPGTFGGAYYQATADRTSDLTGGISFNSNGTAASPNGNPVYWGASANVVTPILPQLSVAQPTPPQNINVTPQPAGVIWQPSPVWDGTPLYDATKPRQGSFFCIDNGSPGPPTTPPSSPSGTFIINPDLVSGVATVKRQSATPVVAALTSSTLTMATGGVNVTNQSYSGLASSIANYHTSAQSSVTDDNTRNVQATQTYDTRLSSAVGVNMDTEMAQLTVLQNAYAANARVISTVSTMFDTLLAIGK